MDAAKIGQGWNQFMGALRGPQPGATAPAPSQVDVHLGLGEGVQGNVPAQGMPEVIRAPQFEAPLGAIPERPRIGLVSPAAERGVGGVLLQEAHGLYSCPSIATDCLSAGATDGDSTTTAPRQRRDSAATAGR